MDSHINQSRHSSDMQAHADGGAGAATPGLAREEVHGELVLNENDSARTPRSEEPPFMDAMTSARPRGHETTTVGGVGRFADAESFQEEPHVGKSNDPSDLTSRPETASTMSSPLHSAGASSSSLQSSGAPGILHMSADSSELFTRLVRVQSGLSAQSSQSRGGSGRHSSRLDKYSPSASVFPKHRTSNEGPNYPDQSFAALSRQPYTPPYRVHSPFLSQSSQHSESPNRSQEYLIMSPHNRTGGNTPVDSPGLYSHTVVRRGRFMEDEMESSQYKAPALHPTHHAAPKESHSLRKNYDAISGHKLINDYEILGEIGKGTHGKVKLARPTGQGQDAKVAIKIVKRFKQRNLRLGSQETQEDKVKKEIAVLKKARHHHVVSLLEVIDDPDWNKVYMVLEYVEEGEMKWRRKADKWTVAFERHRVEREMEAYEHGEQVNIALELAEIDQFNAYGEWRKSEKAAILSRQKQEAYENIASRRSSSATVFTDDEMAPRETAHSWSLEHGGDSETELPDIPVGRRMSRLALASPAPEDLTRRLAPYMHPTGARSAEAVFRDPFVPGSDPGSPSLSAVGAPLLAPVYPEHIEKDKNFQRELKLIQRREDLDNFTDSDEYFRHVPCLTLTRTRECFRDTVLGLEYLHYQGIIHRDIKPANLLWTKEHRVKISDFGVSYLGRRVRSSNSDTGSDASTHNNDVELARTVGTPAFYAPEICDPDQFLEGKDNRRKIGPQMDIWALGVTLYCMVFARLPFFDDNQIRLFEVIAKQEPFIPARRLRAIRLNKRQEPEPRDRPEDFLQYEEIGDELRDLLKRMLHKDPEKRITIKEIKRHPWVVKGTYDYNAWLDETDPANYIKDKTIKVTKEDVSAAIAPLTVLDKVRQFGQRVSSLVRGRDPSKRASSRAGQSAGASSRSTGPEIPSRRSSLRGDDMFSTIRSRPETSTSEHPLSQSQLASPNQEQSESYFEDPSLPASAKGGMPSHRRPGQPDRGVSTTESIRTIRAPRRPKSRPELTQYVPWRLDGTADNDVPHTSIDEVPTSHPASLTQRFGGTSRGNLGISSKRSSTSMSSSKSTSSDRLSTTNFEDPHTLPLVSVSSAVAAGRVETPLISPTEPARISSLQGNRPRARTTPRLPSGDVFARTRYQNMLPRERNELLYGQAQEARRRPHSRSTAQDLPLSPDSEIFLARQRAESQPQHTLLPSASATSTTPASSRPSTASRPDISAASSSDDVRAEGTFSDNSRHPSMPSVVSTSSVNSSVGSGDDHLRAHAEKYAAGPKMTKDALMSTGETVTPAMAKSLHSIMQTAGSGEERVLQGVEPRKTGNAREDEDDAGYNGDGDEDSDDEGIVFGGLHT